MLFQAYIDDSGSDWQSSHFVLSGFVWDADSWEQFSSGWWAILQTEPRINYFKASEAQNLKGQFTGFTEEQRDEKITKLVDLITLSGSVKIDIVMPQGLYDRHVKGQVPKDIDSPYFMCVLAAIEILLKPVFAHDPTCTDQFDFIFDEQQKLWRMAEDIADGFKASGLPYAHLIGNVMHRDEKKFVPLQAADLGAWLTRRVAANPMEGCRLCFQPLMGHRSTYHIITEDDLVGYMTKFRREFTRRTEAIWSANQRRLAIVKELSRILTKSLP